MNFKGQTEANAVRSSEGILPDFAGFACGYTIQANGDCQHKTFDDHLCIFADVKEDHTVCQGTDDEGAGDDPGNPSDTALDGYSAQHNAGYDRL